ncbi:MAG: sigma 54-interacting transcriptional regulator [Candidatus Rokubacteria bacterium]|nr:sigma 54-interacting transcriptional regulator [Candidatus Rokubacteria bacterium]
MKVLQELIGDSPGIEAIRGKIGRLLERQQDARRFPPVLIEGETGTGKGLLARMIHRAGPRPDGPFVDVNCAAIPETLLEAEMFGFERGAFTDARRAKPGLFQAAHRGAIFLDEVGLLPEPLQAKLLKVLEERTVRRLGSTRDEPVDAWVLTATNEDLRAAVRARRFREDLYHRLAVLTLTLPPLRARRGDILPLAEHFLARACADYGAPEKRLTPDARAALMAYAWPGNVRELGNLMERVALLSLEDEVTAEMLGLSGAPPAPPEAPVRADGARSLDDAVRDRVAEVLQQTAWNISRSAALLGISRNTLRARIEKYGLRGGEAAPRAPRRAERPAAPVPAAPVPAAPAPGPTPAPAPPAALRWERRRVTLLRASLIGAAEPDARLETSRAIEALVEKTRSFGGRVEGRSPTGIVAAFGIEATEEAASHAAHAAMAMQRAIERARQEGVRIPAITIGIHADQVLVGLGPGAAELDVEAKQRALGVLAALAERGEAGAILASAAVAPFLERRFELLEFHGGELGRVFALAGRERTGLGLGGHVATFVGRHRELELLWGRLESAVRGQGEIVGISGEAGIGKSRLVYEFRQSLAGKPIVCLEGQCASYGTATPYLPVLDALKASCGVMDADAPEAIAERVGAALREVGMDPAEGSPYLLHLLGIKEGAERLVSLDPDAIKARIFETLRQMWLARSRQHPLVFVLEDLHWIDTTSADLFASLAEILAGSRILLVCTYRAGYRPPWIEKSYATQVALQPLAPDDSLRVLRSVLGAEQVSDALADRIVSKAEGNPLFLEELARTVREHSGDSPTLTVPDTIQEVLRGRIERLAHGDRRLLEIAAVVGREIPFSVVQVVANLPAGTLREAFDRLKAADFLYETGPGPEIEYTFKHTLTHEVAYGSLDDDARRSLHARIVEAIEQRYPDRLAEHVERLAHHAFEGHAWRKALTYLHQAGLKAFSRCAHREALACYAQALVAIAHVPEGREKTAEAIDLRFDLRNALQPLGEFGRILESLREAEALARSLGDQGRLGRAAAFLTDYFRLMGDQDRAIEYGHQALALAETLGDFVLQVRTNTYLGQTCHARGDYRGATQFLQKNVAALGGGREHDLLGFGQLPSVHSRTCLVWCLAELGEFDEGIRRGEEAVRISESSNHPFTLATAYAGIGSLYVRKGDLHAAIPVLERGLELCRSWNLSLWFPKIASALGEGFALAGRVADAVPLLERAVEQSAGMRLVGGHAPLLAGLGEAYVLAGRPDDASGCAARALGLARDHKERGHEAWALRLQGEIALRVGAGSPDAAIDRLGEALTLATELAMRPLVARCRAALGLAYRRAGKPTDAREHLSAAAALLREMGMTLWLGEAEAALAELR